MVHTGASGCYSKNARIVVLLSSLSWALCILFICLLNYCGYHALHRGQAVSSNAFHVSDGTLVLFPLFWCLLCMYGPPYVGVAYVRALFSLHMHSVVHIALCQLAVSRHCQMAISGHSSRMQNWRCAMFFFFNSCCHLHANSVPGECALGGEMYKSNIFVKCVCLV